MNSYTVGNVVIPTSDNHKRIWQVKARYDQQGNLYCTWLEFGAHGASKRMLSEVDDNIRRVALAQAQQFAAQVHTVSALERARDSWGFENVSLIE